VKIVLDTNVLIAAHVARGLAHSVFELCLNEHTIILSSSILKELANGLLKKIGQPPSIAGPIIEQLKRIADIREPVPVPAGSCRDSGDLHVLGLAAAAGADRIVTGDDDLLALGSFRGIPIVSPREFWDERRRAKQTVHESPALPFRRPGRSKARK